MYTVQAGLKLPIPLPKFSNAGVIGVPHLIKQVSFLAVGYLGFETRMYVHVYMY